MLNRLLAGPASLSAAIAELTLLVNNTQQAHVFALMYPILNALPSLPTPTATRIPLPARQARHPDPVLLEVRFTFTSIPSSL